MMADYFLRKCFGCRGRRLVRSIVICAVLYGGVHVAEVRLAISHLVLVVMAGIFSAACMGRALVATDSVDELHHHLMLPLTEGTLVRSYVGALATYTLFIRSLPLMVLLLAVSTEPLQIILLATLAVFHGVLLAAIAVGLHHGRVIALGWGITLVFMMVNVQGASLLVCCGVSLMLTPLALNHTCVDNFLRQRHLHRAYPCYVRRFLMLRYFLRVLITHKNYLMNTLALWGEALLLPFFFADFVDTLFVAPLGFAILTLNTPLGVLLSAQPALDRQLRMLPGGIRWFLSAYVTLLMAASLSADAIFLASWHILIGPVSMKMLSLALLIALQSAVASAWLEWQHPLRGWRMESDLWHHPRKYLVPGAMLLLAVALASWTSGCSM